MFAWIGGYALFLFFQRFTQQPVHLLDHLDFITQLCAVRLAPHLYNQPDDLERVMDVLDGVVDG